MENVRIVHYCGFPCRETQKRFGVTLKLKRIAYVYRLYAVYGNSSCNWSVDFIPYIEFQHEKSGERFPSVHYSCRCHNIIDIFWGLTYFDKIGMGPMGLKISTSMYFCSNAILSFTWFTFLYRLMSREKIQKWVIVLATIPLVTVFFMVIANIWTFIKFVKSKEKSERKKNAIFTLFAVIPMTFDFLQVFFVSVPCTSVAFQIAIIIIYAFISVEISNVSFVREVIGTSGEAQKALNMIEGCRFDAGNY